MTSTSFFFSVYRWLIYPLLTSAFLLLSRFNPKISAGLKLRRRLPHGGYPWLNRPQGQKPIWIHCASGEFEYAKPVITQLKARWPECLIMVTYFSPSIAKAVGNFPGVDFSTPVPWDRPKVFAEFLAWHQPRALLIARTDTWPEMIRSAHEANIPSLLFSATLAQNSGRARGLGRWVSESTLSFLTQIDCVSDQDFATFSSLGLGEKTRVQGDTRYDQVIARLKNPRPIRESLFTEVSRNTCLVAGSTWEEDEAVLIDLAVSFKSATEKINFVFVPHEPTEAHLVALETRLKTQGLASVRYSQTTFWRPGQVLLVDQMGILAELYAHARFAFVGGSFKKTVHSVMEPLAAGCVTFVGPKHLNNREALEFKNLPLGLGVNCVGAVGSAPEFSAQLRLAMKLDAATDEKIRDQVRRRTGKTAAVIDWCAAHVDFK